MSSPREAPPIFGRVVEKRAAEARERLLLVRCELTRRAVCCADRSGAVEIDRKSGAVGAVFGTAADLSAEAVVVGRRGICGIVDDGGEQRRRWVLSVRVACEPWRCGENPRALPAARVACTSASANGAHQDRSIDDTHDQRARRAAQGKKVRLQRGPDSNKIPTIRLLFVETRDHAACECSRTDRDPRSFRHFPRSFRRATDPPFLAGEVRGA